MMTMQLRPGSSFACRELLSWHGSGRNVFVSRRPAPPPFSASAAPWPVSWQAAPSPRNSQQTSSFAETSIPTALRAATAPPGACSSAPTRAMPVSATAAGDGAASGAADEEIAALASLFHDANSGAATDLQLSQLLTALQAQVPRPGLPLFLSALWRHSCRWHLIEGHHDVFGLNIFPPDRVLPLVLQVLGDEELVEQWRTDHPTPNAAEPGWVCFASFSEYDYLFTCMDALAPHFGAVRHVVNNCWEDKALPHLSAAVFMRQVRRFAEAVTAPQGEGEGEGEPYDGFNRDVSFGEFIVSPDA